MSSAVTPDQAIANYRDKNDLAEDLARLVAYDPNTGVVTWVVKRPPTVKPGDIAGTINTSGYRIIGYQKRLILAHRLIFYIMTGGHPSVQIDHINGVRDDNRWENLRECSQHENSQNVGVSASNTSGYPGVSWHSTEKRWTAQIRFQGKGKTIGRFHSKEDAYAAYLSEKRRLHVFAPEGRCFPDEVIHV